MTFSSMLALLFVGLLGVGAGILNTITGFGGGVLLTLALAALLGPSSALVVAAPALAVGHVHRAFGYREHIDRRVARRFIVAAVPGAVLGSLLAAIVPESVLAWVLLLSTILAIAQAFEWLPLELGQRALMPGAGAIGFLAGSCGGGGVLLPPTLMSVGLAGRRFVATAAAGALAVQLVRIGIYGSASMIELEHVPLMVMVALGLIAGNVSGRRLAKRIDDAHTARYTRAMLAVAITLGLWGLL
jgi:uncharacterized membrane protein YfcA